MQDNSNSILEESPDFEQEQKMVLQCIKQKMEKLGVLSDDIRENYLDFKFFVGSVVFDSRWVVIREPFATLQIFLCVSAKKYYRVRPLFDDYVETGKIRFIPLKNRQKSLVLWEYSIPILAEDELLETVTCIFCEAQEEIDRILPVITLMQDGIGERGAREISVSVLEKNLNLPISMCPLHTQ